MPVPPPLPARCNITCAPGESIHDPAKLLLLRLRCDSISADLIQDIHISVGDTKTFLFMVRNGEATVLEDATAFFPSDKIITSLRLLLG